MATNDHDVARPSSTSDDRSRFHAIADQVPEPLWIARSDGWTTWCNRRWVEFTGLDRADLLGYGWHGAIHPEDLEWMPERWHDALQQGGGYEAAFRVRHASGDYRWLLSRAAPITAPGFQDEWFGTCIDVTELRVEQDRSAALVEYLEGVFENSRDAMFMVDDDRRYVAVNTAAQHMLGVSPDEVLGAQLGDLSDQPAEAIDAAWKVLMERGTLRADWSFHQRAGEPPVTLDAVATSNVQPGRHLVTLRDVTEDRRAREELAARETRLRFLLDEMDRIREDERRRISGDIHDYSLQHVIAAQMTLEHAAGLDGAAQADARRRAQALLEDAVSSTRRILQGLTPLHTEHQSLGDAISTQVHEAQEEQATLITCDVELPVQVGEELQLVALRVVREAVINACKHADADEIRVTGRIKGDRALVSVVDDGRGFDPSASRESAATEGMGLALMRERVRAIAGEMTISSAAEVGTTVLLEFPLPADAGGPAA